MHVIRDHLRLNIQFIVNSILYLPTKMMWERYSVSIWNGNGKNINKLRQVHQVEKVLFLLPQTLHGHNNWHIHKTLNQCWFTAGPPSTTTDQH